MTRVNHNDFNTSFLAFVGKEAAQLGECPAMQPAALFAMSLLNPVSYPDKVLNRNGGPCRGTVNNATAEYMVTIPVEAHLLARQLLQVAAGRLCSFGLELTFDAEISTFYLFPMGSAIELALRSYRWVTDTKVYANGFSSGNGFNIWHGDYDMQVPATLAANKVSAINLAVIVLYRICRQAEAQAQPFAFATNDSKSHRFIAPVHIICFLIVARRAEHRVWLISFAAIFQAGKGRCQRFCRLDSRLNDEVTNQSRGFGFDLVVSGVMQPHPVLLVLLPAVCSDHIEGTGELAGGFSQHLALFFIGVKPYSNSSLHSSIMPRTGAFVNTYVLISAGAWREMRPLTELEGGVSSSA